MLRDIFTAIYSELGAVQGSRICKAIKQSVKEENWGEPDAELRLLQEPPFGRFVELLCAEPNPARGMKSLMGRLDELADYGFFAPTATLM